MRLPNSAHESRPWRIRGIVPDFTARGRLVPAGTGGRPGLRELVDIAVSSDPANAESAAARALWRLRDRLGSWFSLGRISAGRGDRAARQPPDSGHERNLAERPAARRSARHGGWPGLRLPSRSSPSIAPMTSSRRRSEPHRARRDAPAPGSDRGEGPTRDRWPSTSSRAVSLREGIHGADPPFRHWIVYPALMRQIERAWARRAR